jgi:hypothetical protein
MEMFLSPKSSKKSHHFPENRFNVLATIANSRILSIYVSQSFSTWLSQNIVWVPRTSAKGCVKLDMTL